MSGGGGEGYSDPWQEYRTISARLKKKFLRKPNLSQAAREYLNLAVRLRDEECLPYAAQCHLAVARVRHQAGSAPGELLALQEAARTFAEADKNRCHMGLPGFGDSLTSAVHCYGHAIKHLSDQKRFPLAGALSIELGALLYKLDHIEEAVEHFERGARLMDHEPTCKQVALRYLALCQAETGLYTQALSTVDELWTYGLKLHGEVAIGEGAETLTHCEAATVMLLLKLKALPLHMNGRQQHFMNLYRSPQSATERSAAVEAVSALGENDFLLLQSFVLAVTQGDAVCADAAYTQLLPGFDHLCAEVGADIVQSLYYPGDH